MDKLTQYYIVKSIRNDKGEETDMDVIKETQRLLRLTNEQMAEFLFIERQTLQVWLSGRRKPKKIYGEYCKLYLKERE